MKKILSTLLISVALIPFQSYSQSVQELVKYKNQVYFINCHPKLECELWKSDGTIEGTGPLSELRAIGYKNPSDLSVLNNKLFFFAKNKKTKKKALWKSDGTLSGTNLIKEINGADYFETIGSIRSLLIFSVNSQIWRSDGTSAGTFRLNENSFTKNLCNLGDKILFSAHTAATGNELWVTDGTTLGTNLILDITPGPSSTFSEYQNKTACNGSSLFFTNSGQLLWHSDGSPTGTVLIKDLTNSNNEFIKDLVSSENNNYFVVRSNGQDQLWATDGTTLGTNQITNIFNVNIKYINDLKYYANNLYLITSDYYQVGFNSIESVKLWRYDGVGQATEINNSSSETPNRYSRLIGFYKNNLYLYCDEPENVDPGTKICTSDGSTYKPISGRIQISDFSPYLFINNGLIIIGADGFEGFSKKLIYLSTDGKKYNLSSSPEINKVDNNVMDSISKSSDATILNDKIFFIIRPDGVFGSDYFLSIGDTSNGTATKLTYSQIFDESTLPSKPKIKFGSKNIQVTMQPFNGAIYKVFLKKLASNGSESIKTSSAKVYKINLKKLKPGKYSIYYSVIFTDKSKSNKSKTTSFTIK